MFSQATQMNPKDRLDQDLNEMEHAITLLKRDFEMFFCGSIKLPPLDSREKLARRLRNWGRSSELTSAQRFRHSSLSARFNSYAELWEKQLRMKEEGRTPSGSFIGIKDARKKPLAVGTNGNAPQSQFEKLYLDFVQARKNNGESLDQVTPRKFEDLLLKQRQSILAQYKCKDIEFYVAVEQNRTKLKARLIK